MKVMTWNINGGYGLKAMSPNEYLEAENLPYFIAQIESHVPDIVCLQEVHLNTSRSQAHEIAAELGYPYVFETAASQSHIDSTYKLANAILSRHAFSQSQAVRLPLPDFQLRLPLLANGERASVHHKYLQRVTYSRLTVANIHLLPLHILGSSYESQQGKRFAREIEKVLLEHLKVPLVLCGDFNAQGLKRLYPRLFQRLSLIDTLPPEPSLPGDKRVDYILISEGDVRLKESKIIKTLSDHFLCVSLLES
jgi:endonuclease/exonuclease/phosphatase family metal-dependent hydrolase